MHIEVKASELQSKKIFVATPMYGGQCAGMYTKACIDLATMCANYGVECRFFFIFNESLITRARNYLVDEFLRAEGFTHLMFIDADINFNPKDVLSLAVLCNDERPIIGGPYGKKCIAWERIRHAVDAGIADENPDELSKFVGDFVFNPVQGTKELQINEPVEVLEIGTGFMMAQREVFSRWKEAYPQFNYKPDHNRSEHFTGDRYIHAYFDTVIDNEKYMPMGSSNNSDRYLSEDYAFCQLARHIGEKIYLCPWMQLGHVGTYVFDGTMSDLGRIDTSNPWADKNMRESDKLRQKRLQEVADAKARQENQQAVDEIENIQKQSESRKERRKATKKK
tara:strand:+ start:328 stop:1338 length:1011 start_codon:yes stop_codon:yes gene_type:complete